MPAEMNKFAEQKKLRHVQIWMIGQILSLAIRDICKGFMLDAVHEH